MQGQGLSHSFAKYVTKQRWMLYYYQIKKCVDSKSKSILVIGKGDGIISVILRQVLEREKDASEIENTIIDTFGYDDRLHPTYVGDIRNLSQIVKEKYDCVICCQVLEHLLWDCFESTIQDIKSICNYKFILSLPLNKRSFQIQMDISHLSYRFINLIIERKWVKNFPYKGEHYWEAGIKDHTQKYILYVIKKYYDIEKEYVIPGNTYHWFVICHV